MKLPFSCAILVLMVTFAACAGPTTSDAPSENNQPSEGASSTQAATLEPTPPQPEASLLEVINLVDAQSMPGTSWIPAEVAMTLYAGGEIWAKESSTALVEFLTHQGVLRVAPNTIFTLEHPEPETMKIKLDSGQIWVNIEGLQEGETFEVETPNATATVRGTRFSVRVDKDGRTVVSVVRGLVDVRSEKEDEQAEEYTQIDVLPNGNIVKSEKIQYDQRILWGLAGGPNLETVVPVYDIVDSVKVKGIVSGGKWSGDKTLFNYSASDDEGKPSQKFYRLNEDHFTPENLPDDFSRVDYNPTNSTMAWGQQTGGNICTANNDGSQLNCFPSTSGTIFAYEPRWAPNGESLLSVLMLAGSSELAITKADGSQTKILETPATHSPRRHIWSPDSKRVAYVTPYEETYDSPGDVWVIPLDQPEAIKIFEGISNAITSELINWSPDGKWLALPGADGLYLVSPDGSKKQLVPGTGAGRYNSFIWSNTPEGWPLLFNYYNPETGAGGKFFVSGENNPALETAFQASWGPVYSPDGKMAAIGSIQNIGDTENPVFESTIYFYNTLP
jgi:hypothetical protein